MKKLLVINILFIYLLAVSGVAIHLHYCGNNIASWNLYYQADKCGSDCEDSEKNDSCCKDEVLAKKITDNHFSKSNTYLELVAVFPYQPVFPYAVYADIPAARDAIPVRDKAPPGAWQQIPLYKLNSNRILYS